MTREKRSALIVGWIAIVFIVIHLFGCGKMQAQLPEVTVVNTESIVQVRFSGLAGRQLAGMWVHSAMEWVEEGGCLFGSVGAIPDSSLKPNRRGLGLSAISIDSITKGNVFQADSLTISFACSEDTLGHVHTHIVILPGMLVPIASLSAPDTDSFWRRRTELISMVVWNVTIHKSGVQVSITYQMKHGGQYIHYLMVMEEK